MSHVSGHDAVSSLLTLVITTSPTPSVPSTGLLSAVLESFQTHCEALLQCPVVVVLDTYEQVTTTPRLKKGYVTPETAQKYSTYKEHVKTLFLETFAKSATPTALLGTAGEAEYGAPHPNTPPIPLTISSTEDGRVRFIEAHGRRLGFGLAVRSALRAVRTPYVWIHQHDWSLVRDIPVAALLGAMQASAASSADARPIKYICLPSGRRSSYAISEQVMPYPALRQASLALTGAYPAGPDVPPVPLTPMFFWHDKPHVAATAHYLARVFPSRLAMMRGAFIEDTVGQDARNQMKDGQWRAWATWLYNPDEGATSCLRHLHGRTWRGEEEEARRRTLAVRLGMERKKRGRGNGSASTLSSSM
ncbi:alcohol dehydrogenase [Cordyceps militaris]|uniref:Alcohol dehydrogenase n=1 Tax=Cordyceps militaris TaxID=73501 RepID=A0A2H4SWB4_CORMI|nr:alcohol dehydrogenase [Cordyceps militaris]